MSLKWEAMVSDMRDIAHKGGSTSQEDVAQDIGPRKYLSELDAVTPHLVPELVAAITQFGNIAAGELERQARNRHQDKSFDNLMTSLPTILDALAGRPEEIEYAPQAMGMLKQKNIISAKSEYPVVMIGKLMIIADILSQSK